MTVNELRDRLGSQIVRGDMQIVARGWECAHSHHGKAIERSALFMRPRLQNTS